MKDVKETKKVYMALGTIVLAAIGLVLGILVKTPVFNTFSTGTWIAFIAFLASLGTVRDTHSNTVPMAAFIFSFAAMCITVFASSGLN